MLQLQLRLISLSSKVTLLQLIMVWRSKIIAYYSLLLKASKTVLEKEMSYQLSTVRILSCSGSKPVAFSTESKTCKTTKMNRSTTRLRIYSQLTSRTLMTTTRMMEATSNSSQGKQASPPTEIFLMSEHEPL